MLGEGGKMTKQEEINEGIRSVLVRLLENAEYISSPVELSLHIEWGVKEIKSKLHSQGVVLRGESLGGSHPHLADYYAVETLIT